MVYDAKFVTAFVQVSTERAIVASVVSVGSARVSAELVSTTLDILSRHPSPLVHVIVVCAYTGLSSNVQARMAVIAMLPARRGVKAIEKCDPEGGLSNNHPEADSSKGSQSR